MYTNIHNFSIINFNREKIKVQALRIEIIFECLLTEVFHKRLHYFHREICMLFCKKNKKILKMNSLFYNEKNGLSHQQLA